MSKLLSSLPVGALVKDTKTRYYDVPIVWRIMEHEHEGEPENSTALKTDKIITFKYFDAAEPDNTDEEQKNYGNNRYLYSNLKQWLNTDKLEGQWYTPQHDMDAPPIYYNENGFLNNFSQQMKNHLKTATKRVEKYTILNSVEYEDVMLKIFLLSNTEVGYKNESDIAEGSLYALFKTDNDRICYPTIEAATKSENDNITIGKEWYWRLRTPFCHEANISSKASATHCVAPIGNSIKFDFACSANIGVRPACCISSSILVSDIPDSNGVYTILWNENTGDNAGEGNDENISNSSIILWIEKSKNIVKIYPNVGENSKMVVIDNLESTDSTIGLSANQGRILSEMIGDIGTMLDTINRKVI